MNSKEIEKYVSDSFEVAKSGDALTVYRSVSDIFNAGNLPEKSHYPFGWIAYYALHQSPENDIDARKRILATYLKLRVAIPHKLHSMVLVEAVRLYNDSRNVAFGKRKNEIVSFSIVNFLRFWGLSNLRPGDWRRKELDGNVLSSTAEKVVTAIVDELEETRSRPEKEFLDFVDTALATFADSFNLYSQRAILHDLCGERDAAKELLKKALLLAPGKFFLWGRMAALVDRDNEMPTHVALLYRALKSPGPDQFKGKIRLSLADCLIDRKHYSSALWELNRVAETYRVNHWHLPPLYETLLRKIPEGTEASDPEPLYRRVANLADKFLYSSLPSVVMRKTFHKNPELKMSTRFGRQSVAWRLTDDNGTNIWFNPSRFKIPEDLPIGTSLRVKLFNGKIVNAEIAQK